VPSFFLAVFREISKGPLKLQRKRLKIHVFISLRSKKIVGDMTSYILLPLLYAESLEGLTPWSRVLSEELIVSQLVKKFLAF